jgi:ribonuclease HII
MRRAVAEFPLRPDGLLVDGNKDPACKNIPTRLIIKGDRISYSIAAASILAKTLRDSLMVKLAQRYPCYGWEKNSGYGVLYQRKAIENHGINPHHRQSFKPLRAKKKSV